MASRSQIYCQIFNILTNFFIVYFYLLFCHLEVDVFILLSVETPY